MQNPSEPPNPRSSLLTRLVILAGLLGLVLAILASARLAGVGTVSFHGTVYPDAPAAPGFSLTDHTGATTTLAEHRGRVVLLFFGFTNCPDACPLTLARVSRALESLEAGPERARVLLVTVDPARDTPEVLARYVSHFGPNVVGLTGEPESLAAILNQYGVYVHPVETHHGEMSLAHSTVVFGIDREGRLRVLMRADEGEDVLAHDIRSLMRIRG